MEIIFTKISDKQHSVRIHRSDNSVEGITLDSRSFLRHDLAHLAVETEIPLKNGYWGLVAAGASLTGEGMQGKEIGVAESLAGPMQGLLRMEADVEQYFAILQKIQPSLATEDLASRIWERGRQLQGHWRATAYGTDMTIVWHE